MEYLNSQARSSFVSMSEAADQMHFIRNYEDKAVPYKDNFELPSFSLTEGLSEDAVLKALQAVLNIKEKQANESPKETTEKTTEEITTIDTAAPQQVIPTNSKYIKSQNTEQKQYYNGRPQLWIKDYTKACKELGLSSNFIKNLLAKDSMESKYGSSNQVKYNFGNITASADWIKKHGASRAVRGNDNDKNGKLIYPNFRKYDSIKEYIKDEVDLLKNLYGITETDSIETFAQKLKGFNAKKRHYAVDPKYETKLITQYNINEKYNLNSVVDEKN